MFQANKYSSIFPVFRLLLVLHYLIGTFTIILYYIIRICTSNQIEIGIIHLLGHSSMELIISIVYCL